MSEAPSYGELVERVTQLSALVAEQAGMIETLRVENAKLRARLGQNPRNSDRPPSTEGYAKPAPRSRRERTGRRPGGQPGREGTTLAQVGSPDQVVMGAPAACTGCGGSLDDALVVSVEARQVFDLPPITLAVVEHRLEHRRCGCGQVTMAGAPGGVGAPSSTGRGCAPWRGSC